MLRDIEKLSGHVVVCGYGRNGSEAVEALNYDNVPVVVIESVPPASDEARPKGVHMMQGDATEEETLRRAGVERARGLITTLPKDADNVFVVLCARELNQKLEIVSRANDEGSVSKLRRAGAHRVVVSDTIGGRRMAGVLLRPTVFEFVNALTGGESGALQLEEFLLKEGCLFAGKTLRECSIRERAGASIVGIKQGREPVSINPTADMRLSAGDTLIALGDRQQIGKLREIIGS